MRQEAFLNLKKEEKKKKLPQQILNKVPSTHRFFILRTFYKKSMQKNVC